MNVWVLLIALAAVIGAQHWVVTRLGLKGLYYDRRLSRDTAFAGETVELIETLRNKRLVFLPWLRVESRVSPYLRFGRQENLDVAGEKYQYHKSVFCLMPFQQVRRRHQVTLTRRGVYGLGNLALTAGDVTGMSRASEEKQLPVEITVYPALLSEDEMPDLWPMARSQGDLTVPWQYQSDPFLVCGIRPYQVGDVPRDIHWSASARTGQMQVKVHDYTADTRLLVLINGQLRPDQWANLMDYEQPVVEYEISLAATLMSHALRGGAAAGFGANMPLDDGDACALIAPFAGVGREEQLVTALAHLQIRQSRSFLSCLDEMTLLRDCDVVILSAYDDEAFQEKIRQLRGFHRSVALHLVDAKAVMAHAA